MKKLLFGLFALVLCMGLTSCGSPDLKKLADRAEKEGAEWSVEQWKEHFKEYAKAMVPLMEDLQTLDEKKEKAKSADERKLISEEEKKLDEKYKDLIWASDRFENAAKATKNGMEVLKDDDFKEEVFKELGFVDD